MLGVVLGRGALCFGRNLPAFLVMGAIVYAPAYLFALFGDVPDSTKLIVVAGAGAVGMAVMAAAICHRVVEQAEGRAPSVRASLVTGLRRCAAVLFLGGLGYGLGLRGLGVFGAGAVIACTFFVAIPAAIREEVGPWRAMNRSAELTRGARWHLFVVTMIVVIGYVIAARSLEQPAVLVPLLVATLWLMHTFNAIAYVELRRADDRLSRVSGVFS